MCALLLPFFPQLCSFYSWADAILQTDFSGSCSECWGNWGVSSVNPTIMLSRAVSLCPVLSYCVKVILPFFKSYMLHMHLAPGNFIHSLCKRLHTVNIYIYLLRCSTDYLMINVKPSSYASFPIRLVSPSKKQCWGKEHYSGRKLPKLVVWCDCNFPETSEIISFGVFLNNKW